MFLSSIISIQILHILQDLAHSISSENPLPAMLAFNFYWTHNMNQMQLTLNYWITFAFLCVPHLGLILTEGKDWLKFLPYPDCFA